MFDNTCQIEIFLDRKRLRLQWNFIPTVLDLGLDGRDWMLDRTSVEHCQRLLLQGFYFICVDRE
ncbi:asr7070 (plasmid) [Nostoc sp. PCC 7120 = FACHB-418]|nr:asr7070 [Nostoc sp. PCC 7120 = FACHB-418]